MAIDILPIKKNCKPWGARAHARATAESESASIEKVNIHSPQGARTACVHTLHTHTLYCDRIHFYGISSRAAAAESVAEMEWRGRSRWMAADTGSEKYDCDGRRAVVFVA